MERYGHGNGTHGGLIVCHFAGGKIINFGFSIGIRYGYFTAGKIQRLSLYISGFRRRGGYFYFSGFHHIDIVSYRHSAAGHGKGLGAQSIGIVTADHGRGNRHRFRGVIVISQLDLTIYRKFIVSLDEHHPRRLLYPFDRNGRFGLHGNGDGIFQNRSVIFKIQHMSSNGVHIKFLQHPIAKILRGGITVFIDRVNCAVQFRINPLRRFISCYGIFIENQSGYLLHIPLELRIEISSEHIHAPDAFKIKARKGRWILHFFNAAFHAGIRSGSHAFGYDIQIVTLLDRSGRRIIPRDSTSIGRRSRGSTHASRVIAITDRSGIIPRDSANSTTTHTSRVVAIADRSVRISPRDSAGIIIRTHASRVVAIADRSVIIIPRDSAGIGSTGCSFCGNGTIRHTKVLDRSFVISKQTGIYSACSADIHLQSTDGMAVTVKHTGKGIT